MNKKTSFSITYQIQSTSEEEALQLSTALSIEQTVEMPADTVPDHLKDNIGRVVSLTKTNEKVWKTVIQFSGSLVDDDSTQFLNVLFGNSSLQTGVKLVDIDREYLSQICNGPVHGIGQYRINMGVKKRPLSCTALKPIGLTPGELAERAYKFSSGGIDMIKDDHGLANQNSATFKARVQSVVRAVRKGEQISGKKTAYFPNITGSAAEVIDRYMQAVELGADGVLISPQLTGLSQMHQLARSNMPLPIMAHPAFSGNYVNHPTGGFSPEIYYGVLWRAFGADFIIYPNAKGRFSFTEDTCKAINHECRNPKLKLRSSFPTPGGGIDRTTVSEWADIYGNDTVFLIGGSLYQHPDGIESATKEFQQILKDYE